MDGVDVLLRWDDGAIGVTGWGWFFFLTLASLASSRVSNTFRKD